MLVNFWYINNSNDSIDIYQLSNQFGDIPNFLKTLEGSYIFCIKATLNVRQICEKFGYSIEGNPIPVIIDQNMYNSSYNVTKNFYLTSSEES